MQSKVPKQIVCFFLYIRHLSDALVYSLTEINLSKKNDFNVTVQFYMRTNPAVHKSS